MKSIAVIGGGITGVTTAYALARRGLSVTLFEKHRYAAMETSFANGGQLSASNAEVWTHWSTILKGIKWMLKSDAPLLVNPKPSWHKLSWFVEFMANIPHYRQNTIATARLAIAAREKELRETRKGNILPRSLGQAIDRYLIEVAPTHRGSRYEALRLHALRGDGKGEPLPPLPVHKLLDEVTVADMTTWQRARLAQVKPATVLREINLLRSVFESARRDWQWCTGNPIKDVRKPPKPPPRRRVISQDELRRLLLALGYEGRVEREGHQVAVCLLLALETAMRAGEMLGLTWGAVHLDQRFVTLPETKNGEARDVPLSRRAVELIELMAGADPARVFTLSSASLDALFRRARYRCGIVDLHFHDSRATALTRLSERLDVLELARMVGHRDLKSLMVYYRKTAAQLAYKLG